MDEHGNFKDHRFEIDITNLLPLSEVVPIPDSNLAAAIRETLRLAPGSTITQRDMLLRLRKLSVNDRRITDLTGLEHAINLNDLRLNDNQIEDITPLSKLTKLNHLELNDNQIEDITPLENLTRLRQLLIVRNEIRDISPLAGLTQLSEFWIWNNKITDITPLSELINLTTLKIGGNQISDIHPIAKLTNLRQLGLEFNQISDVSVLAGLTKLGYLNLWNNQISDVSSLVGITNLGELNLVGNPIKNRKPLLELLKKNPDVKIYFKNDREPLPVSLSHFRAEHTNAGVILKWTTESEVDNAGFYIYRSQTRDGEFKVVNPTMIQGADTTGERNEYTWTDATAKPNTVYYYRIEDVSHTGVREQLATVRLRGLVSASGKLTTRWADLKAEH